MHKAISIVRAKKVFEPNHIDAGGIAPLMLSADPQDDILFAIFAAVYIQPIIQGLLPHDVLRM